MGPRQRRRCLLGRENPCPGPGRPGSSSRVATHKLAAPPAKQVELEKRASTAHRSAIQRASPKNAPDTTMAASYERLCGKTCALAATTQKSQPVGLERQGSPTERPSRRRHQSPSLVLARSAKQEAASWVSSPKLSAGRPRKVSRRTAEKTSRWSVWRPRKVSQGSTDPGDSSTAEGRGEEKNGKRWTQGIERPHHRHCGDGRERKKMGTALEKRCIESGLLLGRHGSRS